MTTLTRTAVRCFVCGTVSDQSGIASTSSFGHPDIDLRPAPPRRWALPFMVQRCPSCGYCAGTLGEGAENAADTVASPLYQGVLRDGSLPPTARAFFCAGLVAERAGNLDQAGWRFVEAAWTCDDENAAAPARACRERAAELFRRALDEGVADAPPSVVLTVTADLLRRAGRFEDAVAAAAQAEAAAAELGTEDDATADVARFVAARAEDADDAWHTLAEVFAAGE